jgi:multiple sugar transport system substrate-binding protein
MSGGTGFVINPNTDTPQEAWELLSFMNSKEQLDAFQAIQPAIRIRNDVPIRIHPS